MPFWIQVHELPSDYFLEAVGKVLGDYAGRFVAYDQTNDEREGEGHYMRIRVQLDTRKSLRQGKLVRLNGDARVKCQFRFERLDKFCYICGLLGHSDKFCELFFQIPADQIVHKWDDSI